MRFSRPKSAYSASDYEMPESGWQSSPCLVSLFWNQGFEQCNLQIQPADLSSSPLVTPSVAGKGPSERVSEYARAMTNYLWTHEDPSVIGCICNGWGICMHIPTCTDRNYCVN